MAPTNFSEGDVNTLQEFLGVPKAHAIILLEKYFNVERAVNQFFEDPVGAVKPQLPPNQWEPADNIPYADDTAELTAMSRPPSRADYLVADTSNKHQMDAGMPSAEEMQDPDLQRAIAMSKQDLSNQETGVIESGQQFGPANRPHYDTNQWAMTTYASSREVVEHPPPDKRQRSPDQPAFLRGSPETGYLAALLNIYHSIPLAREAYLLPQMRVLSYGHDPQWWSGTSDENTKSISIEATDRGGQDRHNFLAELQCLMAFLDGSTRAYGSVDALADLRAMRMSNSETALSRLLETWVRAAMIQVPDNQLTQIFTSTALKAQETEGYSPMQKDLVCLEPTVRRWDGQTLIDVLDSTIWDDTADKVDDIWIHQCAEVFTMRLYDPLNESKGLGLEVPLIWYPDRYMYEHRETTRQWRREMLAIRNEINQCTTVQRRCEIAQGPGKRIIRIRNVLEAASRLSGSDAKAPVQIDEALDSNDDVSVPDESAQTLRVQSQLLGILQRIEEKLKVLESRKQELHNQIKAIASQLTLPSSDPILSPRHKYYLQGVSTKPNITYVRRSKQPSQDLIDLDDSPGEPGFEWWRVVWGKDERPPAPSATSQPRSDEQIGLHPQHPMSKDDEDREQGYSVRVVDEAEVLEAAKSESSSIVLVYASENAMNFIPSAPSTAVKKFVEQDNRAFREEMQREHPENQRRFSQETNTTIMDDISLNDGSGRSNQLREMTPMSMTSPPRDKDGQPSPKRAKGDEAYQVYRESDSSDDEPPPYEENTSRPQMQEKKMHKIGLLADQLLEKYGGDGVDRADDGPVHIEHAKDPLR